MKLLKSWQSYLIKVKFRKSKNKRRMYKILFALKENKIEKL
jgi:hypothetical protein